MLDRTSEVRLSQIYSPLADRARRVMQMVEKRTSRRLRIAQGLRSLSTQMEIYREGRVSVAGVWMPQTPKDLKPDGTPYSHVGIVTWAEPWKSWHVFGLAVDFDFDGADPYLEKIDAEESVQCWAAVRDCVETCALVSGARFSIGKEDRPHAELTRHMLLSTAKTLYLQGGLKAVWSEMDRLSLAPQGSLI